MRAFKDDNGTLTPTAGYERDFEALWSFMAPYTDIRGHQEVLVGTFTAWRSEIRDAIGENLYVYDQESRMGILVKMEASDFICITVNKNQIIKSKFMGLVRGYNPIVSISEADRLTEEDSQDACMLERSGAS